ncbi:DUF6230 family protein [Nocardioides sp. B-3]|uniref:DUF6230 family protein n=1 Tax=Nocardioides sp. B-3 TaxID=2895565 RepID=UPI0021528557|nr:DUF6230 family protein [Nocardioides sp. B-3]UUZ61464.1 DUF6230 family protein [Nocardioides sp. B-3]
MLDASAERTGTRKRGLPLVGLGFALLGVLGTMVYQSVLAVNFTTGNSQIKIYSNYLDAQKAAAYLAPSSKASAPQVGVAELGIKTAKLAGFCAITTESLGVPGDYSLMITAGRAVPDTTAFTGTGVPAGVTTDTVTGSLNGTSAAQAISANNLFLNTTEISGFGNLIQGHEPRTVCRHRCHLCRTQLAGCSQPDRRHLRSLHRSAQRGCAGRCRLRAQPGRRHHPAQAEPARRPGVPRPKTIAPEPWCPALTDEAPEVSTATSARDGASRLPSPPDLLRSWSFSPRCPRPPWQ